MPRPDPLQATGSQEGWRDAVYSCFCPPPIFMARDVTVVASLPAGFLPLFFICQNQIRVFLFKGGNENLSGFRQTVKDNAGRESSNKTLSVKGRSQMTSLGILTSWVRFSLPTQLEKVSRPPAGLRKGGQWRRAAEQVGTLLPMPVAPEAGSMFSRSGLEMSPEKSTDAPLPNNGTSGNILQGNNPKGKR